MQRRQHAEDIVCPVFHEIAKFLTRSDSLLFARTSLCFVKFTKLFHPMLWDLWGPSRYFVSKKLLYALSCLDWGSWKCGKMNDSDSCLYFQVHFMNVNIQTTFQITWDSEITQYCCAFSSHTDNYYDTCRFSCPLPTEIPRHQIRKVLYPLFDNMYRKTRGHYITSFYQQPWILVGKSYSQEITSSLWYQIADRFAELEQEIVLPIPTNLTDDFFIGESTTKYNIHKKPEKKSRKS